MKLATPATIVLDGRKIDYRVVHSKAARKLRVRVGPSGVEVVQPAKRANGEVDKFLHGNTAWIIGQIVNDIREGYHKFLLEDLPEYKKKNKEGDDVTRN